MKLAVVGSRTFKNRAQMVEILDEAADHIDEIVSGGAIGADTFAEEWAKENDIPTNIIRPDYKKFGKGAAFIRNKDVVMACDKLLCFWDGKSGGSKNTIDWCIKLKKPYMVILEESQLTTDKKEVV